MTWPDEQDEQRPRRIYAQLAKERMDLSLSVEETLAEQSSPEDRWAETLGGASEASRVQDNTAIIRPRLTLQSKALVVVRPPADPETAKQPARGNHRLGGRTTRVRLEAAPRAEMMAMEMHTEAQRALAVSGVAAEGHIGTTKRGALSGSGTFERGQDEVAITNASITPCSVVVVTLTGDPGPVVVQYVILRPQEGFTVHLSAPVIVRTPFNYIVLLGEFF